MLNRVRNFPSNCNAVQRFTRWFDVKKGKKERILRLFLPRVVSEKEDVSWRQFCFYAFFSDLNCKVEWASGLECWILTSVDRSPRSEKVIFKKMNDLLKLWSFQYQNYLKIIHSTFRHFLSCKNIQTWFSHFLSLLIFWGSYVKIHLKIRRFLTLGIIWFLNKWQKWFQCEL